MAFDLNNLVRENIRDLVPYSSARGEFKGDARIFLDANENAFGSPLEVLYNRYPDPLQTEIKARIAELEKVSTSQIFIGNGSDEAIDLLVRVFCRPGIDNILICPPTYGMYEVTAAINDVSVNRVNLTSDFQLDKAAVLRGCDASTKLLFLCSPNNPTGNSLKREALLDVLDNFDGIVVVDEAYIHFANTGSLLEKLDDHPNLVILQTFSKAWGLAGLRVGLAFASPDIIGFLNKVKPPYNISQAAQNLILAALGNKGRVESSIEQTLAERQRLEVELRRFDLVETIYPSDANFLLVKVADAAELYGSLLSGQIVVRNRSSVELCDGCLRITVGTPAENTELLRAIEVYETSIIHRS